MNTERRKKLWADAFLMPAEEHRVKARIAFANEALIGFDEQFNKDENPAQADPIKKDKDGFIEVETKGHRSCLNCNDYNSNTHR